MLIIICETMLLLLLTHHHCCSYSSHLRTITILIIIIIIFTIIAMINTLHHTYSHHCKLISFLFCFSVLTSKLSHFPDCTFRNIHLIRHRGAPLGKVTLVRYFAPFNLCFFHRALYDPCCCCCCRANCYRCQARCF